MLIPDFIKVQFFETGNMTTKQLGEMLQDVAKFGLGDTKDGAAREENALPGKTKFEGEADTVSQTAPGKLPSAAGDVPPGRLSDGASAVGGAKDGTFSDVGKAMLCGTGVVGMETLQWVDMPADSELGVAPKWNATMTSLSGRAKLKIDTLTEEQKKMVTMVLAMVESTKDGLRYGELRALETGLEEAYWVCGMPGAIADLELTEAALWRRVVRLELLLRQMVQPAQLAEDLGKAGVPDELKLFYLADGAVSEETLDAAVAAIPEAEEGATVSSLVYDLADELLGAAGDDAAVLTAQCLQAPGWVMIKYIMVVATARSIRLYPDGGCALLRDTGALCDLIEEMNNYGRPELAAEALGACIVETPDIYEFEFEFARCTTGVGKTLGEMLIAVAKRAVQELGEPLARVLFASNAAVQDAIEAAVLLRRLGKKAFGGDTEGPITLAWLGGPRDQAELLRAVLKAVWVVRSAAGSGDTTAGPAGGGMARAHSRLQGFGRRAKSNSPVRSAREAEGPRGAPPAPDARQQAGGAGPMGGAGFDALMGEVAKLLAAPGGPTGPAESGSAAGARLDARLGNGRLTGMTAGGAVDLVEAMPQATTMQHPEGEDLAPLKLSVKLQMEIEEMGASLEQIGRTVPKAQLARLLRGAVGLADGFQLASFGVVLQSATAQTAAAMTMTVTAMDGIAAVAAPNPGRAKHKAVTASVQSLHAALAGLGAALAMCPAEMSVGFGAICEQMAEFSRKGGEYTAAELMEHCVQPMLNDYALRVKQHVIAARRGQTDGKSWPAWTTPVELEDSGQDAFSEKVGVWSKVGSRR